MKINKEHTFKLHDEGGFNENTFRKTAGGTIFGTTKVPATINIVWAKAAGKDKPSDPPQPQALCFPADSWTVETAKAWIGDNKIEYLGFTQAKAPVNKAGALDYGELFNKLQTALKEEWGISDTSHDDWVWIKTLYVDHPEAIVEREKENKLYSVLFSLDAENEVILDDITEVIESYVPATKSDTVITFDQQGKEMVDVACDNCHCPVCHTVIHHIAKALTHNSKVSEDEPAWGTVDKTELPRGAHANEGDPDLKTTWRYPHHWIDGGTETNDKGVLTNGDMYLSRTGLNAAWSRAQQQGTVITADAEAHLQAHRVALGLDKADGLEGDVAKERLEDITKESLAEREDNGVVAIHAQLHGFWARTKAVADDDKRAEMQKIIKGKHKLVVAAMDERDLEHSQLSDLDDGTNAKVAKGANRYTQTFNECKMINLKNKQEEGSGVCRLIVKNEEKRLVYGIVYEPDVVDAHGDFTDSIEIEKACHKFMEYYQDIGEDHFITSPDIKLVECYIAPQELTVQKQTVKEGAWVIAVKVYNDDVWEDVLSGKLTGFSLEGTAKDGGEE